MSDSGVLTEYQLTNVVQCPEPVLPAGMFMSPRLDPLDVHPGHVHRVPDLTSNKTIAAAVEQ